MEKNSFFSIIIPVYNVETYLAECIDSVLHQLYRKFEIILVDDGSTDGSSTICDEYEYKDNRVKVIHKQNGGLSDARNYGIRKATGKYLLFLDSDDYWDDQHALEKIYAHLKKTNYETDVLIFQAKLLYPDGTVRPDRGVFEKKFNQMETDQQLQYLSQNGLLVASACSKAIKRKFLMENGLYFPVGMKNEDIDWTLRLANALPKYQSTDLLFYIYRKGRIGSITHDLNCRDLKQFTNMLEQYSKFSYVNEKVKNCLLGYVAYEYSILMARAYNLKRGDEKTQLLKRIKNMRWILKYDINPKVKKIRKVERVFGYQCTLTFLGLYLRYRGR